MDGRISYKSMDNVSLNIVALATGSKGNASCITSSNTQILIDAGITTINIERRLKDFNVDPSNLDGILITHTHTDHVAGLKTFLKKYHTKVYLSKKMYNEIYSCLTNYEIIEDDFTINDLKIKVIKLSHDTDDVNGYIIENNGKSIVYITDTGYINRKYFNLLKNKEIYVIESNHDITMLMNGSRPYHIKQRILGDRGHLNNEETANYLAKFIGPKTKKVILIHLSEDNNTPDLAKKTLEEILEKNNIQFSNIIVSSQNESTELVSV